MADKLFNLRDLAEVAANAVYTHGFGFLAVYGPDQRDGKCYVNFAWDDERLVRAIFFVSPGEEPEDDDLSGGEATGDQLGSEGTSAAQIHPEFRERHNSNEPNREEVEELRKVASAALTTPWYPGHLCDEDHPCHCAYVFNGHTAGAVCSVHFQNGEPEEAYQPPLEEAKAAQRHIATFDPPTTLRLLSAYDVAQSRAEKAEQALAEAVGWRDISSAPRDGTYVLARVASPPQGEEGRWAYLGGRHFVIRHEGTTPSGYDLGWTLHPGFGGCSDAWFDGWLPLPPAPDSDGGRG